MSIKEISEAEFRERLLTLIDKAVAVQLGVSYPTVQRWREGKTAPHPGMRALILDDLERLAHLTA